MCAVCWPPFCCNLMAQVSSNRELAYSARTSGVLPRQLPIIILERETGPWREKSTEMCASVVAGRQSIANQLLNTHVQNCQGYLDIILKDLYLKLVH